MAHTIPHTSRHTSRHGTARRLALVAVVVAALGIVAYVAMRPADTTGTVAPVIFKTVTVEQGSLGTSEKIDGSVLLSDVTAVLHRIEGQTSSATGSSSNAVGGSGATPVGAVTAASGVALTEALPVVVPLVVPLVLPVATDDCGVAIDGTTPTTVVSAPTTSVDTATTIDTSPTTTTTTTIAPEPTTTNAAEPAPTPTTTCTTVAADTGNTAVPPTGGGPTVIASGGTGTGGTGTGGTTTGNTGRVTQVITSVIADGSAVSLGSVLYSVESSPVVAMNGSLPAWRTMDTSSDDGADIVQLEMNLVALGYDPEGTMAVDDHFDSDTKAVVKAWQRGYGMEVTGAVTLGSVVFVRAQSTVSGVNVAVGNAVGDGDDILSLSASSEVVVIDVPDGDEAYLVPGLVVEVGSGEGTVTLLRSTVRDGAVIVQAVITPTAPLEGVGSGSAVKVTITVSNLDGALVVPTEALVSRIDGSYAVQVVASDGDNNFVPVELLGVSGSTAAIRGDGIAEGTEVLQPL